MELVLLREALTSAVRRISAAQVGSPRLNAEILLMFVLGCDRAYLYAHPEQELTTAQSAQYDAVLDRRASGVPSQYITEHQEFWGLDFVVTPAVLIPRPETEHLIEAVIPLARMIAKPKIVDVGTGSGCIAVALAKELPEAEICATDISSEALEIARTNAARHELGARIQFRETDLTAGLSLGSFDFMVSNPPYVGASEEDQVQLEVRKFEPRNAVFAGPTGLEVIERLIPQASAALKSGGWLVMEISGTIVERVKKLLEGWRNPQIIPDLQGIPRVALAQKAGP